MRHLSNFYASVIRRHTKVSGLIAQDIHAVKKNMFRICSVCVQTHLLLFERVRAVVSFVRKIPVLPDKAPGQRHGSA